MGYYIVYDTFSTRDIYHFGIKGKSGRYPWGSGGRPFQRLEGTGKSKKINTKDIDKKIKTVKDINKSTSDMANAIDRMNQRKNAIAKQKNKPKDLSQFSDNDLRKKINRLNLENTYSQLMSQKKSYNRKGRDIVTDIFKSAGDLVAFGSSAAALYLSIQKIRGLGG